MLISNELLDYLGDIYLEMRNSTEVTFEVFVDDWIRDNSYIERGDIFWLI